MFNPVSPGRRSGRNRSPDRQAGELSSLVSCHPAKGSTPPDWSASLTSPSRRSQIQGSCPPLDDIDKLVALLVGCYLGFATDHVFASIRRFLPITIRAEDRRHRKLLFLLINSIRVLNRRSRPDRTPRVVLFPGDSKVWMAL